MNTDKYVGLDVHSESITVAIASGERGAPVDRYGDISADLHAVENLAKRIGKEATLHFVYEAGPTGFGLYRRLRQLGYDCIVVAPSRMPKAATKTKTDARDARDLASLHRSGSLTAIHVPDEADEAIRDLCRARTESMRDLKRAKQRLKSFLLRHGLKYKGKANWSEAHLRYLRELPLPIPALRVVVEEHLMEITRLMERLERYNALIETHVPDWKLYPMVKALMCMRGVQLLAAAILISEIGEVHRFAHPRQLMAYLGLVPEEKSTGKKRRLGGITKAGSSNARWIMIEIIQHALLPPKVSSHLSKRQEGMSREYCEIAHKAQVRLYTRGRYLLGRGLMKGKIQVALARECVGFVWDILRRVPSVATS